MAPEILKGQENYTDKVDIFGLGVIAYELCTLKNPFNRPVVELVHNIEKLVKNLPPLPDTVDP